MNRFGILPVLVGLRLACIAQTPDVAGSVDSSGFAEAKESDPAEIIDQVPAAGAGEAAVLDFVQYLRDHPYDLNTVTREELEGIPGIFPGDALAVVEYRRSIKRFVSLMQLAQVPERGPQILSILGPYACVSHGRTGRRLDARARSSIEERVPPAGGARSAEPMAVSQEVRGDPTEIIAYGVRYTKQRGVGFRQGSVSAYFEVHASALSTDILLGDYVVGSGQGLVFWKNSSTGKSGGSLSDVRRVPLGVQPCRSPSEISSLRGLAFTSAIGGGRILSASLFLSRREVSAKALGGDEIPETSGMSLPVEGNPTGVVERLIGARLVCSPADGFIAGCTAYHALFDRPFIEHGADGAPRTAAGAAGVDLLASFGRLQFFAEAAWSDYSAPAIIAGGTFGITGVATLLIAMRDYSPRFFNPHAGGFRESDETSNERGLNCALEIPFSRSVVLGGSFDQFVIPAGVESDPLPRHGSDLAVRGRAVVTDGVVVTMRLSRAIREVVSSVPGTGDGVGPARGEKESFRARLSVTAELSRRVEANSRIEQTLVQEAGKNGWRTGGILCQEISWHSGRTVRFTGRILFFGNDPGLSPLREIEQDTPGSYTFLSLSGSGTRLSLLLQWMPASWLRIALSHTITESEVPSRSAAAGSFRSVRLRSVSFQFEARL